MKTRQQAAFTVPEVLVVVSTLLLFALVIPTLLRPKVRVCYIHCPSNQKQVALALRMWANDYEERFPMQVPVAEGGTMEVALNDQALATFISISNELNSPKVLACPQDSERTRTNDFSQLAATNVSYFLAVDASETNTASILIGDRNVCVGGKLRTGLVEIGNPKLAAWGVRIHTNQGNIALADGRVHQMDDRMLQNALRNSGVTTNRFAIP